MIECRNISKSYGSKLAIDNVSIQIPEGKITSFIGPNGAGKSTLLGVISRLLESDQGEALIDQKSLKEWDSSQLAKTLAILKQSNSLQVKITVYELVCLGRYPYNKHRLDKEDEAKVEEAITYMELDDIRDSYLDELSGGQAQRAFIAMIIAQDTKYILLDEPLNNLDIKHSVQMMKILRRLCEEKNKSIIIVLHDINFASVYSDYILTMKHGKKIVFEETSKVIEKDTLERLYEIDFHIEEIKDKKISIYF